MKQRPARIDPALALLASLTLVGCGGMLDPHETERAIYSVTASVVPDVFDRESGALISSSSSAWTGLATVHAGRYASLSSHQAEASPSRASASSSTSFEIPDSTLTQVLDDFGFTPAANPQFVAPAIPFVASDTTSGVDDNGIAHVVVTDNGSFGQVLRQRLYQSGSLLQDILYTWQTVTTGGIQLYRVRVWDYTDPEVLVRTTITVTSGNVVELTKGPTTHHRGGQLAGALRQAQVQLQPLLSSCATVVAEVFLPNALHAATLDACTFAKVMFYGAAASFAVANVAVAATRFTPFTPGWAAARVGYVLSAAGLAAAASRMTAACKT